MPSTNQTWIGELVPVTTGTHSDAQILFYAISGLATWVIVLFLIWIITGHITRHRQQLSRSLITATYAVLLFAWLHSFIAFVFQTDVFLSDARHAMPSECPHALRLQSLTYGAYRFALYVRSQKRTL